ncbi:MAG: 30S ribosomal protein S8 [Nanobdellota archaeon]
MSMNDPLANALSKIVMYEKLGRDEVELTPASNMLKKILKILNKRGYVGEYKENEDHRGGVLTLSLLGKTNETGVIKPRTPCRIEEFEKYEKRYLPGRDFGIIFVSTSKGIIPHTEAKKKKIGGKLIAYCY